MTEAEWLVCDDPDAMLRWLGPAASPRKARLLAAAGCRRIWHLLDHDVSRPGVSVIERHADRQASDADLERVSSEAKRRGDEEYARSGRLSPPCVESDLAYRQSQQAWCVSNAAKQGDDWLGSAFMYVAQCVAREAFGFREERGLPDHDEWHRLIDKEKAHLAAIVRDIEAGPSRPSGVLPGGFSPAVQAIAWAAYEERILPSGHLDNARLAVLSDALEEAGCADADILTHLRSSGPHVRGCWAVDLVLGKE